MVKFTADSLTFLKKTTMSFDPSNCFLYADWKHPMQFFTTITFPLATIYLTVWAFYQQQWFYLLFALLSAGFSVLVYQLYYTSEICWNEEQIVYREGEKNSHYLLERCGVCGRLCQWEA